MHIQETEKRRSVKNRFCRYWKGQGIRMQNISEDKLRTMTLEILHLERKNLRSKAKTDQRMAEEIAHVIVDYSKTRY